PGPARSGFRSIVEWVRWIHGGAEGSSVAPPLSHPTLYQLYTSPAAPKRISRPARFHDGLVEAQLPAVAPDLLQLRVFERLLQLAPPSPDDQFLARPRLAPGGFPPRLHGGHQASRCFCPADRRRRA